MEEEKLTTKEREKPERLEAKNGVIVNLSASEDATRNKDCFNFSPSSLDVGSSLLGKRRGNAKDRQETSLLPAESFFLGGEVRRGTTSPFIVVVEKEKREPNPNPTQSPPTPPLPPVHHRPLAWYCKQGENLLQPFLNPFFGNGSSRNPHTSAAPRRVRDSTKKESRNRRILLLLHRRPSPAYPSHMHIGGEKEEFGMEKKGEMEVGNHFLPPHLVARP